MADQDEKNRLNPIPKGGKKVFSKPVKIGFLDVEEGLSRFIFLIIIYLSFGGA